MPTLSPTATPSGGRRFSDDHGGGRGTQSQQLKRPCQRINGADEPGLGTMATATATDYLTKAGNLAGLADLPTARTNLGLGTAAVANTGTGASNVILGNDSRLTDTRTPSAASIVDAMIASTLSPSKITGTAAILGRTPHGAAVHRRQRGSDPVTGTGALDADAAYLRRREQTRPGSLSTESVSDTGVLRNFVGDLAGRDARATTANGICGAGMAAVSASIGKTARSNLRSAPGLDRSRRFCR